MRDNLYNEDDPGLITKKFWNSLPFDIRNSMRLTQFKSKLAKHFWSIAGPDDEQPEHEWSFQSSDEGS